MVTVSLRKLIVLGMNEVAVGRHGLILRENEATGARKVFRYLRGLRDTIKKSKKVVRIQKTKKSQILPYILIYGVGGMDGALTNIRPPGRYIGSINIR